METVQHLKAMSAFCTQRSKMVGEDELFWLTEAELLARLAINAERLRVLEARRLSVTRAA
jgi:hypothetical protein